MDITKRLSGILKQLGCNSLCKTDGKWVCAYIKGCIYLEQRNKAISQIKSLYKGSELSEGEIEEIIKPTLKKYFGSTVWSLDNDLAKAIISARAKKRKE